VIRGPFFLLPLFFSNAHKDAQTEAEAAAERQTMKFLSRIMPDYRGLQRTAAWYVANGLTRKINALNPLSRLKSEKKFFQK